MKNKYRRYKDIIMAKTEHRCAYCGKKLHYKDCTIDHVHPRSQGGSDDLDNLVACCFFCNQAKGNKSLKEFQEYLYNLKVIIENSIDFNVAKQFGIINCSFNDDDIILFYYDKLNLYKNN